MNTQKAKDLLLHLDKTEKQLKELRLEVKWLYRKIKRDGKRLTKTR